MEAIRWNMPPFFILLKTVVSLQKQKTTKFFLLYIRYLVGLKENI